MLSNVVRGPFGSSQKLAQQVFVPVVTFSILVAVYLPPALKTFGRLDDFVAVAASLEAKPEALVGIWLSTGRLVPAALGQLVLNHAFSVHELAVGRSVAVILIALTAALFAFWASRLIPGRATWLTAALAISFGLVLGSLPAVSSAMYWAIMAPQLVGLLSAAVAGIALSLDATYSGFGRIFVAGLGVFISTFSYQSLVFLALLPPLVTFGLSRAQKYRSSWQMVVVPASLVSASLVANVLWVVEQGGVGASRLGAAPISETLHWWIRDFLPKAASLSVPNSGMSGLLWAIIALLLLLSPITIGRRYLWLVGASLGGISVTALASLAARETYASHRATMALEMWIWAGAIFCGFVTVVSATYNRRNLQVLVATSSAVLALLLMKTSLDRAVRNIVQPNTTDWSHSLCAVKAFAELSSKGNAVFVASSMPPGDVEVFSMDEFGLVSSQIPWAAKYQILSAASFIGLSSYPAGSVDIVDSTSANAGDRPFIFLNGSECS